MDVELAVANGELDIGLFCPEDMMGLQQAESVVRKMSNELQNLLN